MNQPIYVAGLGLWAAGYRDPAAWVTSAKDAAETEPKCALLPSRLARRTSLLTRMAIEVITQAGAKADLAAAPSIFATAYGETETLDQLLEQLCVDGELSPTKFHNSVYNTASGYFTIAAVNRSFTTTLAAGPDTVPMALLEAFAILGERGGEVLVSIGDEAPASPLQLTSTAALAASVHLTTTRPADGGYGVLRHLRTDPQAKRAVIPNDFRANPVASVLPFIRMLQLKETGTVPLSNDGGSGWVVDLVPAGAL